MFVWSCPFLSTNISNGVMWVYDYKMHHIKFVSLVLRMSGSIIYITYIAFKFSNCVFRLFWTWKSYLFRTLSKDLDLNWFKIFYDLFYISYFDLEIAQKSTICLEVSIWYQMASKYPRMYHMSFVSQHCRKVSRCLGMTLGW